MRSSVRRSRRSKSPRKKSKDRQMEDTNKHGILLSVHVRLLYVLFLSARHLHYPAAGCLALASSVGLVMLSMISGMNFLTAVILPQLAIVFLEIAWFCCFRPAVVVSSSSGKTHFLPAVGGYPAYPSNSPKKSKIFRDGSEISVLFPAVYVAHTGFFDNHGLPIYGLYAGAKIRNG